MRRSLIACTAIFVCLLASAVLRGQEVTATLTGTVTDTSGAVVAGAKVTVHNNATGMDVRTATTDSTGVYTIPQLPYGTYMVTYEAAGFQKYVANDVVLHVGEHRALDAVLNVGAVTQEITVTASYTPLQTSTSAQQGTVTATQVRELQLVNRNFELLLTLQPGVASTLSDTVGFGGIANTSSISVNGNRTGANNWMVDGSDVNDSGSNLTVLNAPSIDALQEFTLGRSTYDAQYGRSMGGQVNVVTKSGTSDFHGSAYEFFRNDVLNATNFFVNRAHGQKPPFRFNDWGFTLGGPLFIPGHYNTDKTKTFFFWSEEWQRTRTPTTFTATIPNPQELTGDFQNLPGITLNSALAPTGCISNNVIAASCISPNAQVYINQVYAPLESKVNQILTNSAGFKTYQVVTSLSQINDRRQDIVRLDQHVSEKVQLFARWMNDVIPTTEAGGLFTGSPLPGISSTATNSPGRNVVVHATIQISPTLINEVAYNYTWGAINSELTGLIGSPTLRNALNLSSFPFSDPYGRSPSVSISGGTTAISGALAPSAPYHERNIDKNLYDNVSLVKGNHSIRFGASNQWMRKSENGPLATNGSFTFNNSQPALPSFANFLLGQAASFTQANHDVVPDIHFSNLGAYIQDDWRARSNLTLNLGLRYDYMGVPVDNNGIMTNFDPLLYNPAAVPALSSTTGNFVAGQTLVPATYGNGIIVGQNGCSTLLTGLPSSAQGGPSCSPYGDRVNPTYATNFSPRVGFSWDPFKTGLTTIRAGYGIYYDRTLNGIWEQNQFTNMPVVANTVINNTGTQDLFDLGGTTATPLGPRNLHGTGRPDFKVPYSQNWNFSIQRQLVRNTVLEVAYVGSKGTHLLGYVDINQVPVAARLDDTTANRNFLRPYQGYGSIINITPEFNSNYHSFQLALNRRAAKGLNLGVAYTWSKTLTNNPTDRSNAPIDTYNYGLDYGPATFSRPQILVFNYVYDLPFHQAQQGVIGHLLGGWELSGITTMQDGTPTTIRQSNDPFDYLNGSATVNSTGIGIDPCGSCVPRPDRASSTIPLPHTVAAWFGTSAFTDAKGHFGTGSVGNVLGPGQDVWNIGLFKNTRISERFTTQFRAEFFNAWNHTSFAGFNNNIDSGTAGQLTSAHDPRIIQLALKLYF